MTAQPKAETAGWRQAAVLLGTLAALLAVAAQIVWLTTARRSDPRLTVADPVARIQSRPDIVDRAGRLLATDVALSSVYADPSLLVDLDETVERLAETLPSLDAADLRRLLSDRSRRFAWIRRGLSPADAQRVHDLGLPGLAFRPEPRRVYPSGTLMGHVLGHVDVDNRGRAGIERYLDEARLTDSVSGPMPSRHAGFRVSLDLGVQQGVTAELEAAMTRYRAKAAMGLVLDVDSGETLAAVSLPAVDPHRPQTALDAARADRVAGGVFELGSIFKAVTVALAQETGIAGLETAIDVAEPIEIGRHRIRDHAPSAPRLTVRDIFLTSSNVGSGRLALEAGADRQRAFLARLGLTQSMRTEAGPVAPPLLPETWGAIETVTIGYGHGLAVAPLHFAAAAATLVNGGLRVVPTMVAAGTPRAPRERLIAASTSEAQREIWRLNVTAANGTGRRAEVPGMRVGGKTGTAEMPGVGGYKAKSVIASFVGAFPMDAPRWLVLVSLFEPQATAETRGQITAGWNAAPVTGRIVARIAPVLGVLPRHVGIRQPAEADPSREDPRPPPVARTTPQSAPSLPAFQASRH